MKRFSYILTLGCLLLGAISPSYAQDYQRLGERTIMGTARYVGMAGAMTAIGGDPSAALDNPAGTGLYRHHEVMLTFDDAIDITTQHKSQRTNEPLHGAASLDYHSSTDGCCRRGRCPSA